MSNDTLSELAAVCDAYGLPHSAVALDRHLRNNAAATTENWKYVAETATARLANVERIIEDWKRGPDTSAAMGAALLKITAAVVLHPVPTD